MKMRDLIKECQERPNQKMCAECPYKYNECERAKRLYANSAPCSYEILLEAEV